MTKIWVYDICKSLHSVAFNKNCVSSPETVRGVISFNSILADQIPQLSSCEHAPGRVLGGSRASAAPPRLLLRLLPHRRGSEVGDQQAAEEVTDGCSETRHVHTLQRHDHRPAFHFLMSICTTSTVKVFGDLKKTNVIMKEQWKLPGGSCWTLFLLSE